MQDTIRSEFTKEKPVMALLHLKSPRTENYAREISSKIDCTYSHAVKVIQRLEELDLITSERRGRKKMIQLTEQGEMLAEKAQEFVAELDKIEREQG